LTASYTGFVNGQDTNVLTGSPNLNTTADTNSPVATYPIAIGLGTLATNGNYAFNFTNGTLTVTAFALTIQIDSQTRPYGQANTSLSGTLTGLQNGDNISATYATSADTNSPVDTYPITVSLADPDGKLSNYSVTTNGGAVTVTPATLTVKALDDSKTYDALPYSGGHGVSYTGLVNNDDASVLGGSLTFTGDAQGAINAGTYTLTPAGLTSTNYSIAFADGSLTIHPATLTITANAANRVYGTANPAFSGTVTGFVGTDTQASATIGTLSFTTVATPASDAGSYAINGSGLTANYGNYTFVPAEGNAIALTITPANSANVLISSGNPSPQGSNVTFTATLTPVSPAIMTPTGDVQFYTNGVALGGPVALDGGVASISTAQLPPGSHTVTAAYAGSGNFLGSSNSLVQVVSVIAQTPSTLGLTAHYDGTVTITFQGTPGAQYLVQAVSDLGQSAGWENVSTNIAGPDGRWTFTESMAAHSQRFYRSAKP
jgi:hypothetical protein